MIRPLCLLTALALLVACGADGPPTPPLANVDAPGITLSGTARIGVVAKL